MEVGDLRRHPVSGVRYLIVRRREHAGHVDLLVLPLDPAELRVAKNAHMHTRSERDVEESTDPAGKISNSDLARLQAAHPRMHLKLR